MQEDKFKGLIGIAVFSIVSLLTAIQSLTYFIMFIFIKEIFILLLSLLYLIISGLASFTANKIKIGVDINGNVQKRRKEKGKTKNRRS